MPTVPLSNFLDETPDEQNIGVDPEKRPVADFIDQERDRQTSSANTSLKFGVDEKPDSVAKDIELSNRYGLPLDVVSSHRDEYSNKAQFDDGKQAVEPTSALKSWLAKDQKNASVSHDDLDSLAEVERTASAFVDVHNHIMGAAFNQVKRKGQFFVGGLGEDFVGRGLSGTGKTLEILGRPQYTLLDPTGLVGPVSNLIDDPIKSAGEAVKGFFRDEIKPEGEQSKADQVASGLGQISGQIASVAIAPWLAAPTIFAQGVDVSAENLVDDADAQGASQFAKDAEVLTGGVITGVTEFLTSKFFLKVPQSTIIKNKLLDYSAKVALGFGTEALQETSEDVLRDISHIILTNEDADIDFGGAVDSGEIGGYVGAITNAVINGAFHIRARNTQQTFEQLNEASSAQKLRERSQDSYQGFADEVATHLAQTSEGKLTDVYIDSDVFNQTMEDAGIQRDFINEQFPEILEQLKEADQLGGGDISLPLNKWIGKLAGTEIGEALTPHLRASAEALSLPELEQVQEAQGTIEERANDAIDNSIEKVDFQKSAKVVESTIFDQVKQTGKFPDAVSRNYSAFVRDFFVARANEQGTTPEAVYEQYSLNIKSAALPETQVLNQARAQGFEGDSVIEADEYVQAVEKGLDMSQEARLQRASDLGYNTDQVFYHATQKGFEGFSLDNVGDRFDFSIGVHLTNDPSEAAEYTQDGGQTIDGSNVLPLVTRTRNPLIITTGKKTASLEADLNRDEITQQIEAAEAQGTPYDAVIINRRTGDGNDNTNFISLDPSNIRSTNAAFDPDYQESANLLAQSEQVDSGDVDIFKQQTRGGFDPANLTTILNENTDYSTFLHETAHFFLEVYSDLATQPGNEQVSSDMNVLLDWFGVESLDTWNALSLDERRAAHEQFALNFEIYLFEGKAPSIEMQTVFDRFAAWLRNVYRSIRDDLNTIYKQENGVDLPILTGEVREVMDRMLASEQQIEQAQQVRNATPIFQDQQESGMSDPEWLAYQNLRQEATDSAIMDLSQDSAKQVKWLTGARSKVLKDMQKKTASIRKGVEAEVREQVLSEPEYTVKRFLQFGETVNDDGTVTQSEDKTKLDVDALREFYKDDAFAPEFKELKYGKYGMLAKDGIPPSLVAEMFAYQGIDDMIVNLLSTPSINEEIKNRTDQRMLQEHGELSDPKAIENAVNEALHNKARSKFVSVELRHLAKATQPVRVMLKAARQAAKNILEGKIINDIRPKKYISSEAKAARNVLNAMSKGDIENAINAKQTELLNNQLAAEAIDIQSEVTKITNKFKRIQKPGAQKNMRGDAREQLENLLGRFDLRVSVTNKQRAEDRVPLASWVTNESDRLTAVVPDLPGWILADDFKKHYKDMTITELRDLNDAVSQLETLARREQKMYLEVRNQTHAQEVESILGEIKDVHPEAFDDEGGSIPYRKDRLPYVKDKRLRLKSKFDGQFLNLENMIDVITAGEGKKIFESLFGRLSKSADKRTDFMKLIGKPLNAATSAYNTKERLEMTTRKEKVGNADRYMTREERISVALFYGSQDGRQRLADGNELSESEIQQIIFSLDKKDVDLMNAFWGMSDNLIWPELRDLNKRTTGSAPKKVEAVPFETRFGTVKGGYVPLVYDGDQDSRALDLNTNESVKELLGGTATQAATARSASKDRVSEVRRPLDLSLRAMSFKINETVHDITHREAVADTYRLLQNTQISNSIRSIAGPDVYKAMVQRVREVAVKPQAPSGFSEKFFWYLRKNTLVNMMGASFNTVAINVLGVSPMMRRVGGVRYLRAIGRFTRPDAKKQYDYVLEKSDYMRNRLSAFDRDMNEELNRVVGKSGIFPSINFWFAGLSAMDRLVTMPGWMAGYQKGMELHDNDNDLAVEYADRLIRQSQGTGRPVDLAAIAGGVGSSGEFKRIITMFYNFFNAQLGSVRRGGAVAGRKWKNGEKAKAAEQLTLDVLMIIVVPATLEAIARGQCGENPDLDDYLYCSARSSALFSGSFFPIMRDVLPFLWKQFDKDLIGGFGVRISPVENALETVGRLPKTVVDFANDDDNEADLRTLVRGFGYLFGLPGFQAYRTIEGYQAFADGETDDPTVALTGKRD